MISFAPTTFQSKSSMEITLTFNPDFSQCQETIVFTTPEGDRVDMPSKQIYSRLVTEEEREKIEEKRERFEAAKRAAME